MSLLFFLPTCDSQVVSGIFMGESQFVMIIKFTIILYITINKQRNTENRWSLVKGTIIVIINAFHFISGNTHTESVFH